MASDASNINHTEKCTVWTLLGHSSSALALSATGTRPNGNGLWSLAGPAKGVTLCLGPPLLSFQTDSHETITTTTKTRTPPTTNHISSRTTQ